MSDSNPLDDAHRSLLIAQTVELSTPRFIDPDALCALVHADTELVEAIIQSYQLRHLGEDALAARAAARDSIPAHERSLMLELLMQQWVVHRTAHSVRAARLPGDDLAD